MMRFSLKPRHLKRYKDVVRLLLKHGRPQLGSLRELGEALDDEDPVVPGGGPDQARELAADLEKMGPTFIKLGQLLSTRGDLLPLSYQDALSRLQDGIAPFPFEDVERIVFEELGMRLSRAYASFDPVPIASASLGQVHRASLPDGRAVAVKVQRPGIRERVAEDLGALDQIASFMDDHTRIGRRYHLGRLLDEFRRSLFRELDYRQEARNLQTLAENLQEFDRLVVPLPDEERCTSRVLTMDYIDGRKLTSLSPEARQEIGGLELGDQLFRAYLKQMLVDGFLHADPHPGNVFLTGDHRIALLDLGMVIRITPELRQKLLRLLLSISEGQSDDAAAAALEISETEEDFDRVAFDHQIADIVVRNQDVKVEEIELGRVILKAAHSSARCGARFIPEVSMVGQTLLKLDHAGRILAPDFKPNDSIRQNAIRAIQQDMTRGLSLSKLFKSAVEIRDIVSKLPSRVNRILDAVADKEFEVKIRAIDETRLMEGLQKIANRITLGLVLAALIIGAALLMRVETSFRLLGYPGLAILCFLAAAIGGFALVSRILLRDEHRD